MDPCRIAAEVRAISQSPAPEDADARMLPVRREDVAVTIEPVFHRRLRLDRVSRYARREHVVVAERGAEHDQSTPGLNRFGAGLLIVPARGTEAASPRVAGPDVERAQEWQAFVVAIPISILL